MGDFQIKSVPVSNIKPYAKNPRKNDAAVSAVAKSIEAFGFKQPIVVDKNGVILVGHTRYKAAKMLHLDRVPVIVADDLSAQKAKAYRLADNKTAEFSEWDMPLLNIELSGINEIYMADFGFEETEKALADVLSKGKEEKSKSEPEYYGAERERTFETYNLYDYNEHDVSGEYDMPILRKSDHICDAFIGFNYALTSTDTEAKKGVHFFLDDYQFERIWANPDKYIETLKKYDCVLTPDFSLYTDMPTAMKIWNTYRNRLIGQKLQNEGLEVVPTLSWAERKSFAYAFDGIEPGGVVAVSTIGVKRSEESGIIWKEGMAEALKRLSPSHVLLYGGKIDFDFGKTKTVDIQNEVTARWKNGKS